MVLTQLMQSTGVLDDNGKFPYHYGSYATH